MVLRARVPGGLLVIVVVSLVIFGANGSENGNLYICDTTKLTNENLCYFTCSTNTYDASTCTVCPCSTIGAIEHNINRAVNSDYHRRVNNANGTQLTVTPKPWTQGDVLASSSSAITGAEWQYVLAFELIAPLRDKMMYTPSSLSTSSTEWAKWTKAFVDCHIKESSHQDGNIQVYGTDDIYTLMKSTTTDIHHSVLQYLEEGAIDLVCAMAGLEMADRCPTIQSSNGISQGEYSDCWVPAYTAIYGTPSYDVTLTSSPAAALIGHCTLVLALVAVLAMLL